MMAEPSSFFWSKMEIGKQKAFQDWIKFSKSQTTD